MGLARAGPGEFDTVHSVFIDHDDGDTLYVADRFNDRVQFFRPDGDSLGRVGGLRMPQSVRKGPDGAFYVAELPHRVTVLDRAGTVLARWGDGVEVDDSEAERRPLAFPTRPRGIRAGSCRNDPGPGLFCMPHGIAVDSDRQLLRGRGVGSWAG